MKKTGIAICMIATIILSAFVGYGGALMALNNHNNGNTQYTSSYPAGFPLQADAVSTTTVVESETVAEPEAVIQTLAVNGNPNPASNANRTTMTIPNLVLAVVDTVVEIETESVVNNRARQIIQPGAGSGVIISENGYIVTNNHVIVRSDGSPVDRITVRLRNGEAFEAAIVGRDADTDLAVIKIDANDLPAARFGDSALLAVGEPVIAIGNPLGNLGGTVTEGIISALNRDITIDGETMHLLQTSAAVNQGNSGGGLFNSYGELIGVVNAKPIGLGIEGIGFAIPSNVALSISGQLINYGFVWGRVAFGIELMDINDPFTAMLHGVRNMGLYVTENNPASGLIAGDRIVSIAGVNVSNRAQARSVYLNYNVGDVLEVVIVRGNNRYRAHVTLQQAA